MADSICDALLTWYVCLLVCSCTRRRRLKVMGSMTLRLCTEQQTCSLNHCILSLLLRNCVLVMCYLILSECHYVGIVVCW